MKYLKQELTYFFTAVMFFTRIPIHWKLPYSEAIMNQSQKYFATVGLIVGSLTVGSFIVAQFLFNTPIAVLFSMGFSILLTGAFHEDGFTDVCDSFGGGYGKEKILTIMKDSRVGAYGSIGITILLALKFAALFTIATKHLAIIVPVYIIGHTLSRFIAGTTIFTHQYVTDIDQSKSKPLANKPINFSSLAIGLFCCFIPVIISGEWKFTVAFPLAYLTKMILANYFKKHIGGYTGDCLGTIQQVTEIVIYLSIISLWKFI